jgi:tRNA U34 5-methylaminomethyl-2-thiouridine-forming methyltransferase MnmC
VSVKQTSDGSVTFFSEKFGQTYHSIYGAKTESERIFIELGLEYVANFTSQISILEIGFGTGLNAFLTQKRIQELNISVDYTGIEAYPLTAEQYLTLPEELHALHELSWENRHTVSPNFSVLKKQSLLEEFKSESLFQLIYFDAFSPEAQPELWSEDVFKNMYDILVPNGVLTTYCSKSLVQRNLKSAGFHVEKHKGPPHKREVIRAIKNI